MSMRLGNNLHAAWMGIEPKPSRTALQNTHRQTWHRITQDTKVGEYDHGNRKPAKDEAKIKLQPIQLDFLRDQQNAMAFTN